MPGTFANRPQHKLVLFDVDGTLTLARQVRASKRHDVHNLELLTDGLDFFLASLARDAHCSS
jgi:hypothetical protein